jgi:hypothetical protein
MDEGGIEETARYGDVAFQPVLRVEDRDVKLLHRKILEPLGKDLVDIPRPAHGRSFLPLFSGHAPSQLERGMDTNSTSRSYAADTGEGRDRLRRKQPQRSAARRKYFLSNCKGGPTLGPAAEEYRDQLAGAKGLRAMGAQALPRPLGGGELAYRKRHR